MSTEPLENHSWRRWWALAGLLGCAGEGRPAETSSATLTMVDASTGAASTGAASTGAASTTSADETTDALTTGGVDPSASDPSAADTTSATSTTDPGETCEDVVFGGPFTVVDGTPSFAFALPMQPGVVYTRLEVRFGFDPADWGGECYNPYYDPPKLVPVVHQFLTLRRGMHWCKGGNLGEYALQGPGKDKMVAEVYWRDPPWDGNGCGPEVMPFAIFGGEPTVIPTPGQMNQVELIYDAAGGAIQMTIADQLLNGAPHPDAVLRADEGVPVILHFSNSETNECYDSGGNPSDAAVCCHAPSYGWTFDNIEARLCR